VLQYEWQDANSLIANLIHPHDNMPQDVLDDLRVVDQRHDAHLVLALRDTAADRPSTLS